MKWSRACSTARSTRSFAHSSRNRARFSENPVVSMTVMIRRKMAMSRALRRRSSTISRCSLADIVKHIDRDDVRVVFSQPAVTAKFLNMATFPKEEPCGLHFTLSGPRAVQCSAIWDAIRHTILFYDCTGERFHRIDLSKPSQLHFELASGRREAICG